MKTLKLKDLLKALCKMSKKELEQPLLYNSDNLSLSGEILSIGKSRANLYYTGEDDPATLYTLKELKEDGYDKEDIESFNIEIPKGSFVIKF